MVWGGGGGGGVRGGWGGRGFCFQAEGGVRGLVRSRGLGDVYKGQSQGLWRWTMLSMVLLEVPAVDHAKLGSLRGPGGGSF